MAGKPAAVLHGDVHLLGAIVLRTPSMRDPSRAHAHLQSDALIIRRQERWQVTSGGVCWQPGGR